MTDEIIAYSILLVLLIIFLLPNIVIIKENQSIVIERLGMFLKTVEKPGVLFLIPLVDRVVQKESSLVKTYQYNATHDEKTYALTMTYQIVDIKMFCYTATESHRYIQETIFNAFTSPDFDDEVLTENLLNHGVKLISINEINF